MKVETVVNLPEDLLSALDTLAGKYGSRDELIEAAIEAFIKSLERQERAALDEEAINRQADALNDEAMDVLKYQVSL